jgi:glycosidase
MSYVGAPMIYYGDEAGMWGADDPDDRKPMVWQDLSYENERSHPLSGKTRTDDEVRFDKELYEYYKKLVRMRNHNEALRRGDFSMVLCDDSKNIYAFKRSFGKNEVIVVLNNSGMKRSLEIPLAGKSLWRDELTGRNIEGTEKVQLDIDPRGAAILVRGN